MDNNFGCGQMEGKRWHRLPLPYTKSSMQMDSAKLRGANVNVQLANECRYHIYSVPYPPKPNETEIVSFACLRTCCMPYLRHTLTVSVMLRTQPKLWTIATQAQHTQTHSVAMSSMRCRVCHQWVRVAVCRQTVTRALVRLTVVRKIHNIQYFIL